MQPEIQGKDKLACFGFGRLKRDSLPMCKSWSRKKRSKPSLRCSVRTKLQQGRLRLRRKENILPVKVVKFWGPGAPCSAQHCRKRSDEHFPGMTQVE